MNFRNLRLRLHGLRCAGHDVAHGPVEEFSLPFLHRTTDIAISDQSYNLTVDLSDAESQLALAHQDDGLA